MTSTKEKITKNDRILAMIKEGKSIDEIVEEIKKVIPHTNVEKLKVKIEKLRG